MKLFHRMTHRQSLLRSYQRNEESNADTISVIHGNVGREEFAILFRSLGATCIPLASPADASDTSLHEPEGSDV